MIQNIPVPGTEHVFEMSDLERTCSGRTRWVSV